MVIAVLFSKLTRFERHMGIFSLLALRYFRLSMPINPLVVGENVEERILCDVRHHSGIPTSYDEKAPRVNLYS